MSGGLAGPGSGQQLLQALAGLLGNRPARRCLPAGLGRASPAASIAQVYGATEAVAAGKKISCEEAQEQVLSRDNLDEKSGIQGALIHFRGDLAASRPPRVRGLLQAPSSNVLRGPGYEITPVTLKLVPGSWCPCR